MTACKIGSQWGLLDDAGSPLQPGAEGWGGGRGKAPEGGGTCTPVESCRKQHNIIK